MGKLRQTTAQIQELLDKVEKGEAGGGGLKYAVERTAYITKISDNFGQQEEVTEYEITEEQRAYNIETLEMAARGDNVFLICEGVAFNYTGGIKQGGVTTNAYFEYSTIFGEIVGIIELGVTIDGNAEITMSISSIGLKYSTERTLYGFDEEEMTDEQKAYNRVTYAKLKAGEHVTINVEGVLFPMMYTGGETYEGSISLRMGVFTISVMVILHEDGSVTIPEAILDPLIIDPAEPASMLAFFQLSDSFYLLKPTIVILGGVAHVNSIYFDTYNGKTSVVLCVTGPMQNITYIVDYETGVLLEEKFYPF